MRHRTYATVLVGHFSLLREGLSQILCGAKSRFQIVASAPSIHDLVLEPIEQHRPILLIIDSGSDPQTMPSQIETFKDQHPAGRVAVLADQYVFPWVLSAFRSGANAYFLKVVPSDAFIKALELVMLGETILPRGMVPYLRNTTYALKDPVGLANMKMNSEGQLPTDPYDPRRLSSREEYILRCIGEGDPNKLIARKMGIAEGTVKVHVKAILRKIRVGNRTQAAMWLLNNPVSARAFNVSQVSAITSPADRSERALATGVDAIEVSVPRQSHGL
jgi:two-component system nitrate/nitrite response regulator NarL